MQPLWYRNAAIYALDVAMFRDSDGDGWGDLPGLTDRLGHIRGLGATCVWLLPFYRSPYRDGGYDVSDHLAVDERFGDMAELARLLDEADELGLRVMLDLVVQHTSEEHVWFQEARHDRRSPYRDYYIWADEPEEADLEPIFPTIEDSVWTWDEVAQQFYRHMFYSHEPDLDVANPRVREEIRRIMAFYLRLGVAGFRVDAAPYIARQARDAYPDSGGMGILEEMRDFVGLRRPDAVLLGEVDVPVKEYSDYFGDGDRLTMLLDFWVNNFLFLSLARSDARPLAEAIAAQPEPPEHGQYATWLRNHDELDLERLDEDERAEVMETFAPDEGMRAYGRGIRRRLAPMLDGDQRRIALAHAVLLTLPGTPVLQYGDEIGMGDDLSRAERLAVRIPMQWSDDRNAGFSSAHEDDLVTKPVSTGRFAYDRVNVYEQTLRGDSLLAKVGNMVRTRTGLREVGFGRCRVLDVGCHPVLALRHEHVGRVVVTLANLSAEPVIARIEDEDCDELVDFLADTDYDPPRGRPLEVHLDGYGYRWLRRRRDVVG